MKDIDLNKLLRESKFNFSRSGGKGGQNVNKVETKAELVFNVIESHSLDSETKMILLKKLSNKIDREGNLRIYSQTERSQLGNRKRVTVKFMSLFNDAMRKVPIRIKTLEPISAKLKRLDAKKKQSEKKKARSRKAEFDE